MVATIDISTRIWPLSRLDGLRPAPAYDSKLGSVLDRARQYADAVVEEVAIATGRSPRKGRTLMTLGHVLGWGGLALAAFGLYSLQRPDLKDLLLGPFSIGLLMQLPSGALVRAGRRELRPTEAEQVAVDRRRPVVLLRATRGDDDVDYLDDTLRPELLRFGPISDSSKLSPTFGEADRKSELSRLMEQAVLLVLAPSETADLATDIGWEIETIARRRLAHKLLVLMPTADPTAGKADAETAHQQRWRTLRSHLARVPGFADLPETAPTGLVAVHLSTAGEAILITGSRRPDGLEYARAVDAAIYGMKCHGRW